MKSHGQRTEHYEWLVPIGSRAKAHAFVLGAKSSLCLTAARYPIGEAGWEREALKPGEPRRARCRPCERIIGGNGGMVEERS